MLSLSLQVSSRANVGAAQSIFRLGQSCRGFTSGPSRQMRLDMYRSIRNCRHRSYRYSYMASVKDGSDKAAEDSDTGISQIPTDSVTKHSKTTSPYVDADNVQSWSDDLSGIRHGKKLEGAQWEAVNQILRAQEMRQEHDLWKTPLRNIRNYLKAQTASKDVTPDEVLRATTAEAVDEVIIDPITNRRVRRSIAAASFTPKYQDVDQYGAGTWSEPDPTLTSEDLSKTYEDVESHKSSRYDDPTISSRKLTAEEQSKTYRDLDDYKPVRWNEPDGLPGMSPEEASKQYKDLDKYKPKQHDDPLTSRELTPEEKSKIYNDLDQYGPQTWNEPDGLPEKTPEEKSKDYDDLHKYGEQKWNEPDGLPHLTPEEKSKNYQDLNKYQAMVQWNEPDGLRVLTPEERSKHYEDLDKYSESFEVKDSVLQAHAAAQMDPTPRGRLMPAKISVTVEDFHKKYNDLHKYGPAKWNEPDGLRPLTKEELSKSYDDLHMYGPVMWNEPDGRPVLTAEEKSKKYHDLPEYRAKTYGAATKEVSPKEQSENYDDLPLYKAFENADPKKPWVHPEQATKDYSDLDSYGSSINDGVPQRIHPEELSKNYTDLEKYDPQHFDSLNTIQPMHPEAARAVFENLGDFETPLPSATANALDVSQKSYDDKLAAEKANAFGKHYEAADSLTAEEIRAEVLKRTKTNSDKVKMEQAKTDNDASWDAASDKARESLRMSAESKKQLTDIYAKDPSENSASSRTPSLQAKSTLSRKQSEPSRNQAVPEDQEGAGLSSMDECLPPDEIRPLKPSNYSISQRRFIGRELEAKSRDPYSTEPQGLETSFEEETGQRTLPLFVKHYRGEDTKTLVRGEASEPTSYKVLAYDPNTQSVSVAEASSSVADKASPLALADVLLGLSKPSKFLPFFESLRADGYEVISGNKDVLVFRKARVPIQTRKASQAINPIDMTGRSQVSGSYASPTGFVDYNNNGPGLLENLPPRFKSNIDVRREEPVFSGRGRQSRPKRRLGRKLVLGTVGIAGGAYAVGVLAEYFSTGGLDGLGPRGL